ncbi:MAG: ABC transporter substrate-binding protein [Deltaproteobacteria bacterium]|nr:ABC transporter substrate-binding protein [Deltaproteobacteria bacterium]
MKIKRLMKRLGVCLLVAAVAVTFMAGFVGQVQAEKPRYGGVLKILRGYSPRAPGWPSSSAGLELTDLYACLEPLTKINGNGDPVPFLATSWEYGPDLKSLILTIRKGVKFHDGSDLNAETVKMNLEERKSGIYGNEIIIIESVDVIDNHTVRLNLSEFKNTLLHSFANYNGLMISPKVVEKAKEKKGKKWAKKNPVGTGPFKFVKFERDVILKYERFDGYWQKGKPYLDGVETHYVKDQMTQLAALRAGEAQALWEAPLKDAPKLKKEGFVTISFPGGLRSLASDSDNPESIYADKRIREALEYAIDRKTISDGLGYGYWEAINQYSTKKCNSYNPDLIGRPYNPEKAKQLLKEAGYPNGFKTSIIAYPVTDGRDVMAAIQQDLKKVGIDAAILFYDQGKYRFAQLKGWKNGLLIFGQNLSINFTHDLRSMFKVGASRFPKTFRPPELREVLNKAVAVPDSNDQKTLSQKGVRMISDMAVVTPLWANADIYVTHKSVHDPGFNGGRRGQWAPAGCWLSE